VEGGIKFVARALWELWGGVGPLSPGPWAASHGPWPLAAQSAARIVGSQCPTFLAPSPRSALPSCRLGRQARCWGAASPNPLNPEPLTPLSFHPALEVRAQPSSAPPPPRTSLQA
jgi:hypothetical protein